MRRLTEPSYLDLCCLQKPIIIACGSERVKVLRNNYVSTKMNQYATNMGKYTLEHVRPAKTRISLCIRTR